MVIRVSAKQCAFDIYQDIMFFIEKTRNARKHIPKLYLAKALPLDNRVYIPYTFILTRQKELLEMWETEKYVKLPPLK